MYAVFRISEMAPPQRSVLTYGKDNPDTHMGYILSGHSAKVVEQCGSIRVASSSLALRNEVSREIGGMIAAAARKGAPPDVIAQLVGLRDADPLNPCDLLEVRNCARGLLASVGIDAGRSWSDDAKASVRLSKKLEKYQTERAKSQK